VSAGFSAVDFHRRSRKTAEEAEGAENCSVMLDFSILMKIRQQRLRRGSTCLSRLMGVSSAALAICILLGPGFRVSNLTGRVPSASSASFLENSCQPDSAVSRLERQIPASDKSPRRQASFGALPNAVEFAVCNVTGERTLADIRCDSLRTTSHQNDRAPPG
jgi:hypothetical protein